MTRTEAVQRIRDAAILSAVHRVRYGLGKGGMKPARHVPWTTDLLCDCSGGVAWGLGISRLQKLLENEEWWVETSNIADDSRVARRFFVPVLSGQIVPSDLLVIGDKGGKQGHVAMITTIDSAGLPSKMVDCSSSGGRAGSAFQERPTSNFPTGGIVVRFKGLEP